MSNEKVIAGDRFYRDYHDLRNHNDLITYKKLSEYLMDSTGGAVDPTLVTRLETLENNVIKVAYYQEISSATGTITKPANSTILLDEFEGADAFVSTIVNSEVSGDFPKTAAGVSVDVTSFDASGNYTLSGTPSAYPVALVYMISIPFKYYSSLDVDTIIEENIIDIKSTITISLATAQSYYVGGFPYPEGQRIRVISPVTPLDFFEAEIVVDSGVKRLSQWGVGSVSGVYVLACMSITNFIVNVYRMICPAYRQDVSGTSSYATIIGNASYSACSGSDIIIQNPGSGCYVSDTHGGLYNVIINFASKTNCAVSNVSSIGDFPDVTTITFGGNTQKLFNGRLGDNTTIDFGATATATISNFHIGSHIDFNMDGTIVNSLITSATGEDVTKMVINCSGDLYDVEIHGYKNSITLPAVRISNSYININGSWVLVLSYNGGDMERIRIDRKTHVNDTTISENITGCTWTDDYSDIRIQIEAGAITAPTLDLTDKFYAGIVEIR